MSSIHRRQNLLPLLLACPLLVHAPGCRSTEPASFEPHDRYVEVVEQLTVYVERELADKGIPGLSIALVDGSDVVWAAGFGLADPDAGVPATFETVYRVGSVSKLFTDIGIMQFVERGELDLDVPVRRYLPSFEPVDPFGVEITLRQLMSHRSGLVREPPVGHYFDAGSPSLAETVASLNGTEIVYEPETRIKYSNAAIAVVGFVLEELSGEPFADYLRRAVLEPIGMHASAFAPDDGIRSRLAKATMWSYDADPAEGSRHNRGCAIDLTLYDLATGEPIEMVGLYDEMSERSYPDYQGGTSLQRWHRDLLRDAMEAEGFTVYEFEWWHFDFDGWERYRIGNLEFGALSSSD